MQTTIQKKQPRAVQSDPSKLIDFIYNQQKEIEDLKNRLGAKDRRIAYLETILNQRVKRTTNMYEKLKPCFESMKGKILKIFLDSPAYGFSYNEIYQEFHQRYPAMPLQNLNRRIRELTRGGFLWSSPDQYDKIRFYLRLRAQ